MKIHASGEDYLEAVLVLQKKIGMVRSVDLARHMGVSKPSISHAVGVLKEATWEVVHCALWTANDFRGFSICSNHHRENYTSPALAPPATPLWTFFMR